MKASRITAVGLAVAASLWIFSGYLIPHESESAAAIRRSEVAAKPFRVGVVDSKIEPHSRKLVLSGRTEADRKVIVTSRASGVITELKVRRGSLVKTGDVIAVLSDEAREAQVEQARALATQRKTEIEAKRKLIASGALPKLDLVNLESQQKAAEAALAAAEAERERGVVRAPWAGVVSDVLVEVGQATFSVAGREIAQIVALDPMLAVVEAPERKLAGIKVGEAANIRLVTGETVTGRIRYVAKSASPTTRTYRIEVQVENASGKIPDGITAEVVIKMASVPATRVPRSALIFSAAGDLGVRVVDADDKVAFVPVMIAEDGPSFMWVGGIADGARVIVQGQDFVREGLRVEAVAAFAEKIAGN
ncbi:MAG TPA: efflux RND transporter periplasmic adaptor subunit [Methyloceanibacter sp.]|nr:efflux RND transporter periplasmic adaptor subunit [Methyloceanibacter sp.]